MKIEMKNNSVLFGNDHTLIMESDKPLTEQECIDFAVEGIKWIDKRYFGMFKDSSLYTMLKNFDLCKSHEETDNLKEVEHFIKQIDKIVESKSKMAVISLWSKW